MSTLGLRPRATSRARDLLTRDLATVQETAPVATATSLMRHLGVRHLPVLGLDGLVGLLYDPDLGSSTGVGVVADHVTRDVPQAHLLDDLDHLETLVATSPCDAVVVVGESGHLLGVITATDLARVPPTG